jgi:hypothetical protein
MQRTTKNSFEREGFRAHDYLSKAQSRPRWKYKTSSRLTSVLAEEDVSWKKGEPIIFRHKEASPKQLALDFDLEGHFQSMAEWWLRDTEHMSNLIKACNHPAYQRIIGMGKVAPSLIISLILRELQQRPDHWFVALHEISNEDPALQDDNFDEALQAWLNWGRRRGYLT